MELKPEKDNVSGYNYKYERGQWNHSINNIFRISTWLNWCAISREQLSFPRLIISNDVAYFLVEVFHFKRCTMNQKKGKLTK